MSSRAAKILKLLKDQTSPLKNNGVTQQVQSSTLSRNSHGHIVEEEDILPSTSIHNCQHSEGHIIDDQNVSPSNSKHDCQNSQGHIIDDQDVSPSNSKHNCQNSEGQIIDDPDVSPSNSKHDCQNSEGHIIDDQDALPFTSKHDCRNNEGYIIDERDVLPSTNKHDFQNSVAESYVVEARGATKISIRRTTPNYIEMNSSEDEPFSDGSSDNYEPDSSSTSTKGSSLSSSKSKTENVATDEKAPDSPVKGKKRTRNTDKWKQVKAKRLRNLGKEYISKKAKIVTARQMKPTCSEKCILSCSKRLSEEFRKQLFKEYWELGSLQRQRDFLGSCVEQLLLKYRRISSNKPRQPNSAYYVLNDGQKVRVCKTFLINTLGITEKALRTVIVSKVSGKGFIAEDKRGKHQNHRKLDEEISNSIIEHITSIPRVESHYIRSDTTREFIDGGLSIADLHRNYTEQRLTSQKPATNYDAYSRTFNTKFNIGFFNPKKDQCDQCESYKNGTEEEKASMQKKYDEHLTQKQMSREEKEKDKKRAQNGEIVLAVYDLQAVLPVPIGQSSAFYYKSRLNCYNFTVTEITSDKTISFFWHEALGNRGAIEIGTCVLGYLEELSKNNPGCDVVFFSDNCLGQPKNRFFIAAYLYAVGKFEIKSITHKFLIRGHTQNEGDAIHSIIEKKIRRSKKSGPIYVPDQYVAMIRDSKKKGNIIEVKEMGFEDFYDLKRLFDDMNLNITKNVDGNDFKINEVKILEFQKGSELVRYKTSYDQTEWLSLNFTQKKRRSSSHDLKNVTLKKAYSKPLQLSENKKRDLKSLIDNKLIPTFYAYFYDSGLK